MAECKQKLFYIEPPDGNSVPPLPVIWALPSVRPSWLFSPSRGPGINFIGPFETEEEAMRAMELLTRSAAGSA